MAEEKKVENGSDADAGASTDQQPEQDVVNESERDAIYADFEKTQNTEAAGEDAEATPEEEAEGEEEVGPEGEDTEPAPEDAEGEDEDPAPEKDEEKTVPLGALHEEREKRKGLSKEVIELKDQVKTLIEDNRKFMEQPAKSETETADFSKLLEEGNLEDAMLALHKENQSLRQGQSDLKANDSKRTEHDLVAEQAIQHENFNTQVASIASDLEKEGYPGFDMFVDKMNVELDSMIAEDPDNVSLDNEAGYKRIYKEKVFPKVKAVFAGQVKDDAFAKKKALKEKANLGKGSGKPGKGEKKDDDTWTFDDYTKMRGANSGSMGL